MRDRMQFLRFMYTCLFESSEFGGSCFDPLYFHYNMNLGALEDTQGVNDTFIFGGAVKVSPIVHKQNGPTFKSHFPKGRWLNLGNLETLAVEQDGLVDLKVEPIVNSHLRPGSIIPWTDLRNPNVTALRTADIMNLSVSIVINRNERKAAKGTLFLDDGISKSALSAELYEYYTIEHKATKTIQVSLTKGNRQDLDNVHYFDKFIIGDASDLENTDFACVHFARGGISQLTPKYDATTKTLALFRDPLSDPNPLMFSQIGNVFYGNKKTDLNLCQEKGFEYEVDPKTDLQSLLAQPEATFTLIHKEKVGLPDLKVTVGTYDEGIINVKWTYADATGKRTHFPVPDLLVDTSKKSKNVTAPIGDFVVITMDPFTIKIRSNKESNETLFEIDRLVYDQYLNWIGMKAFTQTGGKEGRAGILGLGERSQSRSSFFYRNGIYPMWAFDNPTQAEDGELPGKQGYGAHPFFMYQHANSTRWVGVFSKHAQAQDWIIRNDFPKGQTILEQVSTGGVTDLYIMINSHSPDSVVGYYQRIIGKPVLMPQWTLGWHQCKYCLRTVGEYRDVITGYKNHSIPIDAQWGDIDYMHNYQNFKVDKLYFGDLSTYVNESKANHTLKFVPIVDAGISARPGGQYSTYNSGIQK
jgi:alpha-glucosidase (family GH31 glycosyl hydrolase)